LVGISFIKDSIRPNEEERSENSGSRSQDSKDLAKFRKQEPRLERSCKIQEAGAKTRKILQKSGSRSQDSKNLAILQIA
jgi:hypothetical protein